MYINFVSFFRPTFFVSMTDAAKSFCSVVVLCDVQTLPSKTTQKMYSITKLMTAQIFYKTTTGELFPIALPWMITHQRWWLLVFVYKTLLFDCTFQQSHHPIIVTLNYREKKSVGGVFNLHVKTYANKFTTAMYLWCVRALFSLRVEF